MPDVGGGVDDQVAHASAGQVPGHRQSGLSGADDEDVEGGGAAAGELWPARWEGGQFVGVHGRDATKTGPLVTPLKWPGSISSRGSGEWSRRPLWAAPRPA